MSADGPVAMPDYNARMTMDKKRPRRGSEVKATFKQPHPGQRTVKVPQRIVIVAREGLPEQVKFELESDVSTGGRTKIHDIYLPHHTVSKTHFEIERIGKEFFLKDLGSTNGTWAGNTRLRPHGDGVQIFPRTATEPGSNFWAGSVALELVAAEEEDVPFAERSQLGPLLGDTQMMRELFALIERVAPTDLDVLIQGKTGTGKEKVAQLLHELSGSKGPFVTLDCTKLSPHLAEAKLMGYRRGAFTGADADTQGYVEAAQGGILFLDEIGELPLDVQPQLLRVFENREVIRIGEHTARTVDVRFICATHRNLKVEVAEGRFGLDLYHRISEMVFNLPPLRDRKADIPLLARHFVEQICARKGRHHELTDDAIAALQELRWEGNVRELRRVLRRTVILVRHERITAHDLREFGTEWTDFTGYESDTDVTGLLRGTLKEVRRMVLRDFVRRYCAAVLTHFKGSIPQAAIQAGYTERGFLELLKRNGIDHRDPSDGSDEDP